MYSVMQQTKRKGTWANTGTVGTYPDKEAAEKAAALLNRQQSSVRRYVVVQQS